MSLITAADTIIHGGRIATLDWGRPFVSALAIANGRVLAIGDLDDLVARRTERTQMIDLGGRTVVPGLNDSHLHVVRGGLTYNMELRWEGVPSLAEALRMLRKQAERTPPPQWVRVVGGWSEFQFAERRLPTLQEVNDTSPDTPVFILHLYTHALLNRAALRALGYTRDTPDPPGGVIERDDHGEPTGLLIATPNVAVLYGALGNAPPLGYEAQVNSTRQFMRELNRLGITSAIDAGGGGQRYPDDYEVISELTARGQSTVRIAYSLFTSNPGGELDEFKRWDKLTAVNDGDDRLKVNNVGEVIVYSAYDFENFSQPRPEISAQGLTDLGEALRWLVERRWPFRLHATYDETVGHYLDVFEAIDRQTPFAGLHWFFDHCETISERNIDRVAQLGGGIAVQDRMAFAGEQFVARYGQAAADATPPVKTMLAAGVPVGAGSDATRVASYNPWVSLYWLVTGRTIGGQALWSQASQLDRTDALRLYTQGSAWFSREEQRKGALTPGQFADLAVLSADYFSVDVEDIKAIESLLTIMDGEVVFAQGPFSQLAPPPLPVEPDWSPVAEFGGAYVPRLSTTPSAAAFSSASPESAHHHHTHDMWDHQWGLSCPCIAF
jgi:predicted amidohydrolase YtcJ